ncbi:MAG: calcium/sodium antiporter [Kiritimatiellae bacterium]|nr:calcium/sodium antiporter [Kiritimatiellia bacterium]
MYIEVPLIVSILLIASGLWLLSWSANRFVDSSAVLAKRLGVPPFIIGMVVIGFGTSAPELAVSALSAASGHSDLSLGNAYGSNIYNIAVILGVVALLRPVIVRSATMLSSSLLLVGISLLSGFLVWHGGAFSRLDAIISLVVFALLLPISCWIERKSNKNAEEAPLEIATMNHPWFWTLASLLLLVGSSHLLVWGAVDLARAFGVSELMVGLTVVAAGTSLPELASAVVAARKGQNDFVVGNIVGSNFFNTLAVVGVSGFINPFSCQGGYVLTRDLWVMVALSASLLVFGCSLKNWKNPVKMSVLKGGLWVCAFIVYFVFLVLQEVK